MSAKVGIVQEINDGNFFVKDSSGNTKELKNGDIIYENDVVFSDGSNSSLAQIRVALEGEDIIVLKNGVQQLFDSSLIASTFGDEEMVFAKESIDAMLDSHSDITNVWSNLNEEGFSDYQDITEEETAAGEEEEEILKEGSIGQFASRDGDITDIVSDLRKKSWIRTQNYKEVENSEALEKASLKPLGENIDTIVSIPRPIAPNPIDTIIPIAPTPETPIITEAPTPAPTEAPTEAPTDAPVPPPPPRTIIKVVAADENGDPLKDGDGNYLSINEAPEGGSSYYVALAFKPGTNIFNDSTKHDIQEGTVDFIFTDKTATKNTDLNAQEGTNDYKPQDNITTITLGTAIKADALDDYMSDNGEQLIVKIENYTPPAVPAGEYGETTIDTSGVTTTITDNSKPNTPNDQTDDTVEADKDIVIIKLFAADENGNVIKDASGIYQLANSADEVAGSTAKYIAYAFNNNETVFKDTTKLTTQIGQVNVEFTDGTATGVESSTSTQQDGTADYNKTAKTIQIGTAFSTEVFKDTTSDLGETYTVKLIDNTYASYNGNGYESVDTDNAPVETTIKERLYAKIEKIVANGDKDVTNEGAPLQYTITIVDEAGNPITVTSDATVHLNYKGLSAKPATKTTDYTAQDTVIVANNTNKTIFTLPAIDDYFAEGDEQLQITITEIDYNNNKYSIKPHTIANGVDASQGDKIEVIGTIKDNPADEKKPITGTGEDVPSGTPTYGPEDTVYVKLINDASVIEGNDLVHYVQLVDASGNAVVIPDGETITLTLTYNTTTGTITSGDFVNGSNEYNENNTITVTLDKDTPVENGIYKLPITNKTIDDFVADNNEVYTLTITDVAQSGAFENVVIDSTDNSVTGTILDGVILGDPVDAKVYEDGLNTSATTEDDLGKSLGITNPNSDTYTVSFDKTITTSTNTSNGKAITYSYNTDGTILTATRAGDNKIVFTVELKKDGSGNDVYDFKLIEPMDHDYGNNGKNQFYMPFEFNVTSNGTTSSNKTFNVTVVDSVPSADAITANTKEDTEIVVRLADDDFKAGEKVTINSVEYDIGTSDIVIYEKEDTAEQIGSLTINSNGTVTFTPIEDYSNHDTTKSPEFTYTVKDFDGDEASSTVTINVKPVADTITITPSTPTMTEDDGNTKEGTHQVSLGLTKPTLSKDQTDKNSAAGDHPERNGEITLTFTNGDKVTGAKVFSGVTEVADITTANQTLKVIITNDGKTEVDYTYHHADIKITDIDNPPAGTVYLTKDEYEGLIIQHAEDNDTNIKIKIDATSYEVNDSNKPLSTTDADLYETATANMTVKINPATDDISLNWNEANGKGTFDAGTKTFTFTTEAEGKYFDTPIDLKALLTKTSGTETDSTPKGGDLDGSEKRTYTVTGIPEGTVITLGTQTAVANASGIATLVFNNTNNTAADPDFSMKLPEHYSGIVNGTIKLSVQDKGVDSGDIAGETKTAEVYFNVEVTPVADQATIQVSQAVGFEDAGRSKGNTVDKDGTIDKPEDGIPLEIKVSSDDKDGSETFNVTISEVPDDGAIYYNGGLYNKDGFVSGINNANVSVDNSGTGWAITINEYDNNILPKFIPPHNDDTDYTLKVSAETKDGTVVADPVETTIDVIVKNVADAPKGTDLKDNINVNEDNQLNFKSIYTTPANLASYDGSEVLTVKIELIEGFTIDAGSPFYVENGLYVVKASDITAGNIKLNIPKDFSGDASFKLTYVTTEEANEGDSKTWDTDTVSIFVNPIADNVVITTSSTIYEDADGSANKLNLKPTLTDTGTTHGTETIDSVKILASGIPAGYELYLDSEMTTSITSTLDGGYYVLTATQADSVYVKNTTLHDADSGDNFSLSVIYTVTDTNTSTNTNSFTHTHTVNVKAVTDAPTLTVGDITQVSGTVTIDNATDTVTVNADNSEFNVAVTTSSPDTDGSETVQKIVISGVPTGVSVEGATYYGYSGSKANGIWVITPSGDDATKLDTNGALENIKFKINSGADFENRAMTITTYTKDGADGEVKEASKTINIVKSYTPGTKPGNPAELNLAIKATIQAIDEDVQFNLGSILEVTQITAGDTASQSVITFTDIPKGSTVSGYDYSYEDTVDGETKTYYVVVGNGNVSDMNTKLSQVLITTPKDMNSEQEGALQGNFTLTADIVTSHNGAFKEGNTVTLNPEATIAPVTDAMTVAVTAANIDEDGTSNLSITLSNPSDGTKTELVGSSLTITVTETWADTLSGAIDEKGELWYNGSKLTPNGDGTYTIPLDAGYVMGSQITGLEYKPAENRDGSVNFEVSVQNKETGSSVTLDSTGNTNITVTPVIDVVLNASVVTAAGIEDVVRETLANPVKLEITAGTFEDGSEKLGNIILDEVPNGFTVWYIDNGNLVMAINIGTTDGGTFDLTPNISGDADVHRNKWLVPATADGSMPEVYINAPTNWSGDFDFDAIISVKEQNLATSTAIKVDVTGKIEAVADGVTIDPTLTFGEAFSWVDLKLNANMKDVDGSETMSLELTGLNESAQFRLKDGTALNATLDGTTWKLDGIAFDQINNIELLHDKSVNGVSVIAKTVDTDGTNTDESDSSLAKTFDLKLSDVSGNFKLDAGLSLNFDNIDALSSSDTLKNIDTIDLSADGENKLDNLTLQDVLDMTDSSNILKITGTSDDEVSFKGTGWSKTTGSGADAGFDIYSNTGNADVKVKVEPAITDGITN